MGTLRWCLSAIGAAAFVGACTCGVLLVQTDVVQAVPSVRLDQPQVLVDPRGAIHPTSSSPRAGLFRDGRYQVTGYYLTPGGNESIGVTVVLSADTITTLQVRSEAHSPTALQFQDQFRQHIDGPVVGRDLASVSVSRVSGASLTSVGFDDALVRIRSEAKK